MREDARRPGVAWWTCWGETSVFTVCIHSRKISVIEYYHLYIFAYVIVLLQHLLLQALINRSKSVLFDDRGFRSNNFASFANGSNVMDANKMNRLANVKIKKYLVVAESLDGGATYFSSFIGDGTHVIAKEASVLDTVFCYQDKIVCEKLVKEFLVSNIGAGRSIKGSKELAIELYNVFDFAERLVLLLKSLDPANHITKLRCSYDLDDLIVVVEIRSLVGNIAIFAGKVVVDDAGEGTVAIVNDLHELRNTSLGNKVSFDEMDQVVVAHVGMLVGLKHHVRMDSLLEFLLKPFKGVWLAIEGCKIGLDGGDLVAHIILRAFRVDCSRDGGLGVGIGINACDAASVVGFDDHDCLVRLDMLLRKYLVLVL